MVTLCINLRCTSCYKETKNERINYFPKIIQVVIELQFKLGTLDDNISKYFFTNSSQSKVSGQKHQYSLQILGHHTILMA